jgi:predicted RNase H-like HicB family nuclease
MAAYIALLRKDKRSDYSVEFPDLPGCITAGKTLEEAREFAREALALHLKGLAEDGAAIPAPSALDAVVTDPENRDKDTVAFLVDAPARKPKAVPVTITVSEDLFETVKAKSAEFGMTQSGVFAEGAKMYLKKLGRDTATGRFVEVRSPKYSFTAGRKVTARKKRK